MTKFTIVIPTRERADTLFWTIKTCIAQDYQNLTILVSDNCSNDNTREVVHGFNDSRIQYIRTTERLSMSDHWDFALNRVKEGYVCIIGDDDGLAPKSLQHVDMLIQEYDVQALSSKDKAIYFWPEYLGDESKGLLQLSLNNTFQVVETKKFLAKSIALMRPVNLPQLYHGFVNTRVLENLPRSNGKLLSGSIPDIYSSVLLGASLKTHLLSNYPFTIHGLSHHSIGTSFFNRELNAEAAEKFIRENKALSHPKMVLCGSTSAIFADMMLHANNQLENFPAPDIKKVLTKCMQEASSAKSRAVYEEIKLAMLETARMNGMQEEMKKLLIQFPFVNKTGKSIPMSGFVQSQETLYLPTLEWNIQEIFGAFNLIKTLLSSNLVPLERSIPRDSVTGFITRKLSYYLRLIRGKA